MTDNESTKSTSTFADGNQISKWAKNAVNWALNNGIMKGKSNTTLDPSGAATRAEFATMMVSLHQKLLAA